MIATLPAFQVFPPPLQRTTPLLSGTFPPLFLSFNGCWLITARGTISRFVPASHSDVLHTTSGGRINRSRRHCAAITPLDPSPLFSCTSCSSRPTRSEEEKTRRDSICKAP